MQDFNEMGNLDELREKFPPAHAPFIERLKENGRHRGPILLLDNNKILVRVGAPYVMGEIFLTDGSNIGPIEDITSFGRSPKRKYFAIAKALGVEIYEGWEGQGVVFRKSWLCIR